MRKTGLVLAMIMLLSILMPACAAKPGEGGGGAALPSKPIELNFTSDYMESHPTVVNGWKPWAKQVDEKTKGLLKITYYNPNTIAPSKELQSAVIGGTVDIAGVAPINYPGKFPLSEVIELPFMAPSAEAGSLVAWELYKKFPEWRDQYKETQMLFQWASATYQLHTTKKLVKSLEDLKGMKIIAWSPKTIEQLRLLGANPVEVPPLDTYLALERNMADGVICPLAPIRSMKISDAAKYHTIIDLGVSSFQGVMNQKTWDGLPADFKKVMEETTGENLARVSGKTLDEGAISDSKWLKENGHTFYKLPDAERERWTAAVKSVHEQWLKDMDAKGFKVAKALYDETVRLSAEYAKKTGRGYQE